MHAFLIQVHNVGYAVRLLVFAATIWTLQGGYAKENNADWYPKCKQM